MLLWVMIKFSDGAQSTNSNTQSRKASESEVVGSFVSSVVGDDHVVSNGV